MMDKRTIWVVAGCLAALVLGQTIVNRIWPPLPKQPAASAATNQPPTQLEAAVAPAPVPAPVPPPVAAGPATPRPAEELVTLSNEFVRVAFTSYGGGIRRVELVRHRVNGAGVVVLNHAAPTAALATDDRVYTLDQPQPDTVVLRAPGLTKRFVLGDGYLMQAQFVADGPAANLAVVVGTASAVTIKETPDLLGVGWRANAKYDHGGLKHVKKEAQTRAMAVEWAAVKNQFFALLVTPATNAVAVRFDKVELPRPADWTSQEPWWGMTATLELPPSRVTAAGAEYELTYYAGPKEYDRLVALGAGQEGVMEFGMFGFISVWLLKGMSFFHRLLPNYGVAIILITLIIKILFWPVQAKSIKSMKEMQKFQPLMAKLREKFKDDPQRMNTEMMKLYKEHKINPFAGCLPMVVQIPVFFAFYSTLRSAVELRGAPFLWIKDLSLPDTVLRLGGFPLNPLPLVMGVSMIWQMKLTPQAGDSQQQKLMMFMPVVFLFICYNMSSGLVLYWTVQQFLSIAQQWWSLRQHPADAALPATARK